MITDMVIFIFGAILRMIMSLLPRSTLDWSVITEAVEGFSWVGQLFDVESWAYVLGLIVSYEIAMVSVRVGVWAWKLIKP